MRFTALAVALFSLCSLVMPARAAADPRFDQSKLAAVPERMRQFVADHEIAGAVTLIATRYQIVQLEAVGQANIAKNEPMRTDSIFWIASMTKPVTATAILMLQDEGKLSVDDPASKYIPELGQLKTAGGAPAVVTL